MYLQSELSAVTTQLNSGKLTGKELEQLISKQTALNNVSALVNKQFATSAAESTAFKEAQVQLGLVYGKNSEVFKGFSKEVVSGKDKLASLSEAGGKTSGAFTKVYSVFRQIANVIPGLGLSGLILLLNYTTISPCI
jgi:hypothetical protein